MNVLVTGFEPFKKEKVNPSWEVCRKLSEVEIEGTTITVRKLPVVFDEARKRAVEYCDEVNPDVILHLGEAGGRTHISLERIAINCDDAQVKDNKGQKRDSKTIEQQGGDGYFTTVPAKEIVKALKKAGIPAVVSNSAGTYLCNHVFYGMLHHVKRKNLPIKVGFIHLPYLPQQTVDKPGNASMSLDVMVEAVKVVIEKLK